jgi:tetratricopeptide (TPR) repeat protein
MGSWVAAVAAASWCALASAHPGSTQAIAALDERLETDPSNVALRLRRAALSRRAGHLHDALADVRAVLRAHPDHRTALLERALIRLDQGRARKAESDLDAFLASGEPTVLATWKRAELRAAGGRFEEALADYDLAIRLGGTPELYLARGRLAERMGRLDDAASGYAEGLEALDGAHVLRMALIEVELRRGRPVQAIAQIDALIDVYGDRPDWLLLRAKALDASRRGHEATAERLRALSLADADLARRSTPAARLSRARAYLALQHARAALADVEQVLLDAPRLQQARDLHRVIVDTLAHEEKNATSPS